jgi:hypothetical protein
MTTETALVSQIDRTALKKKVADGTIKLPEVWKALSTAETVESVETIPLPAVITAAQQKALAKLVEVYGKVVPTEARALTDEEVSALMDERETLDEIGTLAEDRKKEIRTTVLNHFDVGYGEDDTIGDSPRDKDGHVLKAAKVASPDHGKVFSWELRQGGGTLDPASLLALVEAGTIERSTYLAMTTQVRVLDENKVMLELKKHPELIDALGEAVTKTSQTGSFNVRKAK